MKMKTGDLVRLKRKMRFMTAEDWNATGIIIQSLTGGSHRKEVSHEVLWSRESSTLPKWHTQSTLELAK